MRVVDLLEDVKDAIELSLDGVEEATISKKGLRIHFDDGSIFMVKAERLDADDEEEEEEEEDADDDIEETEPDFG
jgi:hypothetical protein